MRSCMLLLFVLAVASSAMASDSFRIVVNPALNVGTLPAQLVSDIFLRKATRWTNGVPIIPVDQAGAIRDEFSQAIHGRTTGAVKNFWVQQIYAGRTVPPLEKRSDDEVIAFVKATPGAIGYVRADVATDSVRVVPINP